MILKKVYKKLTLEKWNIAFIENPIEEVINNAPLQFKWLEHTCKDRWFADPFILEVTDNEIILLVEEFYDPIKRGRISKLIVDKRTKKLKDIQTILELDSHLSFPAIWRENDNIYIYPENSDASNLTIYKYDASNNIVTPVKTICKKPLTDAIITDLFEGRKMIFSTNLPTQNKNKLSIYEYNENNNLLNKYTDFIFEENIARMAGDFFMHNNKIYRPAQDCNKGYGKAVLIQEVIKDNENFVFYEIRRIKSPHPNLELGFHTFNLYKDTIVVDARGYRHPIVGRFCSKLRNIFK